MKRNNAGPSGRRGGGRGVNMKSLSRRGGGRFGKPIRKDTGPEARRKWLHHCLRTLHKALKNARMFDQRKLKRRIAQLAGKKGNEQQQVPGAPPPGDGKKLLLQLEAAKELDLDVLAVQLALKSGFPEELVRAAEAKRPGPQPPSAHKGHQPKSPAAANVDQPINNQPTGDQPQLADEQLGSEPAQQPQGMTTAMAYAGGSDDGGSVVAVLAARLMRASCVRKCVEEARRDFGSKFGADSLGADHAASGHQSDSSSDEGGPEGNMEEGDEDLNSDEEGDEDRGLSPSSGGGGGGGADSGQDDAVDGVGPPAKRLRGPHGETVRVPPQSIGEQTTAAALEEEEGEDSGVIEEADIEAFMAEEGDAEDDVDGGRGDSDAANSPTAVEDDESGGCSSMDGDGDSGGRKGPGDGSDLSDGEGNSGGSIGFDSEDYDIPARMALTTTAVAAGRDSSHGAAVRGVKRARGDGGGDDEGDESTCKNVLRRERSEGSGAAKKNGKAVKREGPGSLDRGGDDDGRVKHQGRKASRGVAAGDGGVQADKKKTKDDKKDPLMRGKNRLGQKARRQLYEKLYGNQARHVQQQRQQEQRGGNAAWRPGRSDTADQRAAKGAVLHTKSPAGGNNTRRGAAGTDGDSRRADTDPATLHPSWAAKQRQKQLMQQQAASAAPKKIKFDDDGDVEGGDDGGGRPANDTARVSVGASGPSGRVGSGSGSAGGRGARGTLQERGGRKGMGWGGQGGGGRGSYGGRGSAPGGRGTCGISSGGDLKLGAGSRGDASGVGAGLHPSWAARQKQKQLMAVAAPAGKKVVFDD